MWSVNTMRWAPRRIESIWMTDIARLPVWSKSGSESTIHMLVSEHGPSPTVENQETRAQGYFTLLWVMEKKVHTLPVATNEFFGFFGVCIRYHSRQLETPRLENGVLGCYCSSTLPLPRCRYLLSKGIVASWLLPPQWMTADQQRQRQQQWPRRCQLGLRYLLLPLLVFFYLLKHPFSSPHKHSDLYLPCRACFRRLPLVP